jgi:dihydroorotase
MAVRPAAIGRLDGSAAPDGSAGASAAPVHGRPLIAGSPANILLYDPAARSVVDPAQHASRSRNTPFAGLDLPGQVVATFLRGEPTVLDGKLAR